MEYGKQRRYVRHKRERMKSDSKENNKEGRRM